MAQRFENTQDPINQPVAYFATLVKRLKINKLDLGAAPHYKIKNLDDIDRQEKIQILQVEYRTHQCDYRYFAQMVEKEVARTGLSFEEATETSNMGLILEDMRQKISTTENALDQLMNED